MKNTVDVETDFDLPADKRREYAISALDHVDLAEDLVHSCVVYDGWMYDAPKDCDAVEVCKDLKRWLKARDRELQEELEGVRKRLKEKWRAA